MTEVHYFGDHVKVQTSGGDTFRADKVIVTVPLGLLKADGIAFRPPLPEKKLDAIRSLGAGIIEKVGGCQGLSPRLYPHCLPPSSVRVRTGP